MLECPQCYFDTYDRWDLENHLDAANHWLECDICTRFFSSQHARNQHMDALGHWAPVYECQSCDGQFHSWNAVCQHMDDWGHWAPNKECETCSKKFHTQAAANQHMNALWHWNDYCPGCDRTFMNNNNLRQHLHSKTHRGHSISCPFCELEYTTAAGLTHHLERGGCHEARGLNRETIYEKVRERDLYCTISSRLIGTPITVQFSVTDRAFNGQAWECYICHRLFPSPSGLQQHLDSPTHQQKLYHCPNSRGCGKEFVVLAALLNHLEAESCHYMRFEGVQKKVEQFFDGRGMMEF